MNKMINNILYFAIGAGVGAYVTHAYNKKKIDVVRDELCEIINEYENNMVNTYTEDFDDEVSSDSDSTTVDVHYDELVMECSLSKEELDYVMNDAAPCYDINHNCKVLGNFNEKHWYQFGVNNKYALFKVHMFTDVNNDRHYDTWELILDKKQKAQLPEDLFLALWESQIIHKIDDIYEWGEYVIIEYLHKDGNTYTVGVVIYDDENDNL